MITSSENNSSKEVQQLFVQLFRDATPFINAFRDKTFVIYFSDGLLVSPQLHSFIRDLTLLHSLGIKLILVHGARNLINKKLDHENIITEIKNDLRITTHDALAIIKKTYGQIRLDLENILTNTINNNLQESEIKEFNNLNIISGNLITAQPIGIIDGINYLQSGKVRKINTNKIHSLLNNENIILLSPFASSPSGEDFNLNAADLATECAIRINADKLIFMTPNKGIYKDGQIIQEMTSHELMNHYRPAKIRSTQTQEFDDAELKQISRVNYAANHGVNKIQLLDHHHDGGLLLELFTNHGIGTLISRDNLEEISPANGEDINGIKQLILPLEESGMVVNRTIDELSHDINKFYVLKRERQVIACAALYISNDRSKAELACLAVNASYQHSGRASKLFNYICEQALINEIKFIYVLTTQASHWFKERGFVKGDNNDLPPEKQKAINQNRRSEIYYYKI